MLRRRRRRNPARKDRLPVLSNCRHSLLRPVCSATIKQNDATRLSVGSVQSAQTPSMDALRTMQSARSADSSSASHYAASAGHPRRTLSNWRHSSVRSIRSKTIPQSALFLQSRQFAWRPRSLPAVANPFDAHSTVLVQSPAVRSNSSPTTATADSPPPLRPNPSQSDYNSAHIRPRETTHFRRQTQAADQGGNQWSPLGNDKQHQS